LILQGNLHYWYRVFLFYGVNMGWFNLIKKTEDKQIDNQAQKVMYPAAPMNVIKDAQGNIETQNVIDNKMTIDKYEHIKDGSLRSYVGNMATLQNNKDVISNSQYTYEYRILEQYLENAYQQSWLAKRIVELPVEMAMANGLNLILKNKDDVQRFWKKWNELGLTELVSDTQKWADVYGSSIILLKNKNQDPSKPYTNYKNLEFIQVQYPFYMPMPKADDVYETDSISCNLLGLTADIQNTAVFYGTKCIKRLSPMFKYFGMSVYQNMWKAMISDDLVTTAVANIIYRSSTPVYKLEGFDQLVAAGKHTIALDIISTTEMVRGIFGAVVLDNKNDFQMVGQSITALADLDRRSAERVCGAVGYPATLILGKSPDGMNSTGKHDEKNTIVTIKRYQQKMIKGIKTIALALIRHLEIDETDWDIEFNNPHSQDREEEVKTEGLLLDNAMKYRQIFDNPNILNRYYKENELITEEEAAEQDKLKAEFDEADRFENEKGDISSDKDAE